MPSDQRSNGRDRRTRSARRRRTAACSPSSRPTRGSRSPSSGGASGCRRRRSPSGSRGSRRAASIARLPRRGRPARARLRAHRGHPHPPRAAPARKVADARPRHARGRRVPPHHRRGLLLHEAPRPRRRAPRGGHRPLHALRADDDLDRAVLAGPGARAWRCRDRRARGGRRARGRPPRDPLGRDPVPAAAQGRDARVRPAPLRARPVPARGAEGHRRAHDGQLELPRDVEHVRPRRPRSRAARAARHVRALRRRPGRAHPPARAAGADVPAHGRPELHVDRHRARRALRRRADGQQRACFAASLRLTRWLQARHGIATRNVIGHNENLSSPYHRERVARLRKQTHGDMRRATMRRYRRLL